MVATGLANPVAFVMDPLDPSTFYVVEQRGTIRTVRNNAVSPAFFLDVRRAISSGGERGLLGLAFPPDHATSRRFYVNFTNPERPHGGRAIHRATPQGVVDPASRFDLMWPDGRRFIEQPFSNHNGGHLAFGPDGYLYIGLGDGGSGGDPLNNAQNPNTLLGKMLRIDVNVPDTDPRGYRVPDDNPFVDRQPIAALTEIWAFGLRNPWRYSFDDWTHGGTGALVIADVGQNAREEVNWEPHRRGRPQLRLAAARGPRAVRRADRRRRISRSPSRFTITRAATACRSPAGSCIAAPRSIRCSTAAISSPTMWPAACLRSASRSTNARKPRAVDLLELTEMLGGTGELGLISSFGVDGDAELYIVSYSRGRILKIVP